MERVGPRGLAFLLTKKYLSNGFQADSLVLLRIPVPGASTTFGGMMKRILAISVAAWLCLASLALFPSQARAADWAWTSWFSVDCESVGVLIGGTSDAEADRALQNCNDLHFYNVTWYTVSRTTSFVGTCQGDTAICEKTDTHIWGPWNDGNPNDFYSGGGTYMDATCIYPYIFDQASVGCVSQNYVAYPQVASHNKCPCEGPTVGDPIDPGSGEEAIVENDYRSADGKLTFSRRYSSSTDADGRVFSAGWQDNFDGYHVDPRPKRMPVSHMYMDPATACTSGWQDLIAITPSLAGISVVAYDSNAQNCVLSNGISIPVYGTVKHNGPGISWDVFLFRFNGTWYQCDTGSCNPPDNRALRLTTGGSGYYTVINERDAVEQYDYFGNLQSVTERSGYQQTLSYQGGVLAEVDDSNGRKLSFTYVNGELSQVSTPDGVITYGYDGQGRLSTVSYPDGSVRTYQYNNSGYPHALTGVLDENNSTYITALYDGQGRAYQSSLSGGVDQSSIDYTDGYAPIVTDPLGVARTYHYADVNGVKAFSYITGAACPSCGTYAGVTYDANSYFDSTTDWNGNVTRYVTDGRGLETSRTEAYGTAQARTITTTWHATFRLPTEIDDPGRQTTFSYDASGNLLTRTVTDTATSTSRTWTYSNYTALGQPQTIDGPRTDVSDVTQIAYWPIVSGDNKSGQVHTVTDALSHVTSYDSYDPSGRPTQLTDPNGTVTTLSYWPRGWLHTVQVGSQLTTLTYWPTGLLKQASLPSGVVLNYTYNAAHQLTDVVDQLGDSIHYTPDAMGNNTQADVKDPSNTLVQTHQWVYNTLNQLYQDKTSAGKTTTYGFDNNNNLTSVSDPLSHATGYQYDALDRLKQVTDAASGLTQYGYNGLDQLTGVTDPRSLATAYTVDALGNTSQLVSPDSGTSTYTYDAAGNVHTRKDAKNQTTTYTYDALNRLTLATRADSSTVTYTWDQNDTAHGAGIGRLTKVIDSASGIALDWKYDAVGNLLSRTETIGTQTLVIAYAYDATTGHRTSMTLPSGKVVGYTWTNGQVTALTLNGAALMSSIVYQPFGGPKSWTFANGESISRTYDLDGRLSADPVESTIGYDDASRITGTTLGGFSVLTGSHTFGYDPLDRLTSFTGGTSGSYSYDANGNRTQQILGGVTTSYTIDTASNRLSKTGTLSYGYDANGSRTSYNGQAWSYDAAGRLTGFTSTSQTASYAYDGLNERLKKTVGSNVTVFAYDDAGHLVGEYGPTGNLIQETVYLGDIPVSVRTTLGTFYVHADWRNAPRQIDNSSGQAAWVWDPQPFGDNLPNNNPLGLAHSFVYNLRYPGQYYDSESLVSYNVFRNYEAKTGRYLESDPIGLKGGANTYSYAGGNPLSAIDALGLSYAQSWGSTGAIAGGGLVAGASIVVDVATGGLNILATPAEVGAGAVGGGMIGYSLGSMVDQVIGMANADNSDQSKDKTKEDAKPAVDTTNQCQSASSGGLVPGRPPIPPGATLVRRDSRKVNSDEFKSFCDKNNISQRGWLYVMETWRKCDGTFYERHYWTNGILSYYHL